MASSGSALPGRLATEWMDRTGDNLYNLYGSTEVGQATIAAPADLRARAGHGRAAGAGVDRGRSSTTPATRCRPGTVGRIFVGNGNHFDGYTGGGTKDRIGGLMSTGDLGYFDDDGRLYVGGRSDDMIVTGGENVFPREVEDLLVAHPGILDAAVVGVDETSSDSAWPRGWSPPPAAGSAPTTSATSWPPGWPATRSRATSSSSTSSPATPPASCCGATCARSADGATRDTDADGATLGRTHGR